LLGEPESYAADTVRHLDDGARLVEALRDGDEDAFVTLIERYHVPMLALASVHVSKAVAEEVVRDTWLGLLNGIRGCEPHSPLRTWIFRILMDRTRTRIRHAGRVTSFAALWNPTVESAELSVGSDRFHDGTHPQSPHRQRVSSRYWGASAQDRLLSQDAQAYIRQTIDALPASQREVIILRDMAGCSCYEVSQILSISESTQRALLHRARSKLYGALEQYFEAPMR
jgi:RNA polymerase sigma-70 factor (ECF subfamily)